MVKNMTRILLVEDNVIATKMALHILAQLNCHVDHASTGETALSLAKHHPYDLIFMDVGLPDISGLEVTRRIRLEHWNADVQVPIIALTAHVGGEDKQKCIEAGMNAVLSKPLMRETAADILNAFIPKHTRADSEAPIAAAPAAGETDTKSHLLTLNGAARLKEACSNLDSYLRTGARDLADALYQQMLDEIEQLRKQRQA